MTLFLISVSFSFLNSLFSLLCDYGPSWVVVRWSRLWVQWLWVLFLGCGSWSDGQGRGSDDCEFWFWVVGRGLMVVGCGLMVQWSWVVATIVWWSAIVVWWSWVVRPTVQWSWFCFLGHDAMFLGHRQSNCGWICLVATMVGGCGGCGMGGCGGFFFFFFSSAIVCGYGGSG